MAAEYSDRCHSTTRVLAVGDCNTSGITVPPIGNTIVDKFCRHLETRGYQTSSQNLGYGMATSREGVQLMRHEAERADVVLINFGLVDTWITSIPRCYISYYPESVVKKPVRKLLKFVKRRLRAPWLRRLVPVGPVVPIEEYEENIRQIISLALAKNPSATILLWGSPPVQGDSKRNQNLLRYDERLCRIAKDLNSTFLTTVDILASLPAREAYLDTVHLGEAATESIAVGLMETYQSRQLAGAG